MLKAKGKNKILIVEDDDSLRMMYSNFLKMNGYEVETAINGQECIDKYSTSNDIDLILMDHMMPVKTGISACKELKDKYNVPIIILTAKDSEEMEYESLNVGADDFVSKLTNLKIILARIKSLLIRYNSAELKEIKFGKIIINDVSKNVFIDDEIIELSPKEYELLKFLIFNKNNVIAKRDIMMKIWGNDNNGDYRPLDTYLKRLRKKLGPCRNYLETVWSMGYKFVEK